MSIVDRITAQKRALGSVLSILISKNHLGNPEAGLRILKTYGNSVLFSGIGSLVLTGKELSIIDKHQNDKVRQIQKFIKGTPKTFSLLIGGSLPSRAIFHLRQLSLYNMICHLPEQDPLKRHARFILSDLDRFKKSWFYQISDLCKQYCLPSCLSLLNVPLKKDLFKRMAKEKVIDYWQHILRKEAESLPSLRYFNPYFCTLSRPSKAYRMAGSSRYEVKKLGIQLKMQSGRYRTEMLRRFWSSNSHGHCILGPECQSTPDTISHILGSCPVLDGTRNRLITMWFTKEPNGPLHHLLSHVIKWSEEEFTGFVLDPLANPYIISMTQCIGEIISEKICYLTRTFCFSIHNDRNKIINQGEIRTEQYV